MKYKLANNKMMKSLTTTIFILIAFFQGFSQNYDFFPSKNYEKIADASGYSSDQVLINNLTSGILNLKWKKVEVGFPTGWDYSLCDLGSCYPSAPDSATMNPTDSAGDAYFICHMTFNNIVDSGYLKLFVYEDGNETGGDTVTFRYVTTPPTGIGTYTPKLISIYPNPTASRLNIDLGTSIIRSIKLYDTNGKLVLSDNNTLGSIQTIDISPLPPSQYILHIEDSNKKTYIHSITINR
ncbi:MAG: T9SS type A sorting domain-containing protein [Flavobacteriales bacterium]|nr:T9SS type A sorting domain-containing protein [Flavobacteriales bacterium]